MQTALLLMYVTLLILSKKLILPRDAMRKRGLCCDPVSVRLSVRPSVMLVHCIHTAEDSSKPLSRPGSPIILVRRPPAPILSSKGTPLARAQSTRGRKILRFSTEIAVYLGNGTRLLLLLLWKLIGSHTRSIE